MDVMQLTKRLRKDLSDVRTLAELSRKRESRKLGQAQIVQEVLSQVVFAHEAWLRMAFENIVASVHFLLILDNPLISSSGSTVRDFSRTPSRSHKFPTTSMWSNSRCGGVPSMRSLIDMSIWMLTHSRFEFYGSSYLLYILTFTDRYRLMSPLSSKTRCDTTSPGRYITRQRNA